MSLCGPCYSSLRRGHEDAKALPPKLAICNNWCPVPLPDEITRLNPTWAELSCSALGTLAVKYDIIGQGRNKLTSQCLVFFNEFIPAECIPRSLNTEDYFVVFAKLSDAEVVVQTKKTLLVRRKVSDLLTGLYRKEIMLYSNAPHNDSFFNEGESEKLLLHLFVNDGMESAIIRNLESLSDRPGRAEHASTSSMFSAKPSTFGPVDADNPPAPTFRITRSSLPMLASDKNCELSAFPDLYSNGLSTIHAERTVKVSAAKGQEHLLRIGLRTFAQHPIWSLYAFDKSNNKASQGLLSARMKQDPRLVEDGLNVNTDELREALKYQHDSRLAVLRGAPLPSPPENIGASRLLRNIKYVQEVNRGSEEERENMRRSMFAAMYQRGGVDFQLTLVPSDVCNGIVAYLANGVNEVDPFLTESGYPGVQGKWPKPDSELKILLNDADVAKLTRKIRILAEKDSAASAQYFEEVTEFLFKEILGFDSRKHTARLGLFGVIDWYGGGVECQGNSLLHFHVCIKVRHWPDFIAAFEENVSNEVKSPLEKDDSKEAKDEDEVFDVGTSIQAEDTKLSEKTKIYVTDFLNHASYPVLELLDSKAEDELAQDANASTLFCPGCAKCTLNVIPLTLFHQSDAVENPPFIAECRECNTKFTSEAFLKTATQTVIELLKSVEATNGFNVEIEVAYHLATPFLHLPIPDESAVDSADLANILSDLRTVIKKLPLSRARKKKYTAPLIKFLKDTVRLSFALGRFQEHKYVSFSLCFFFF